MSVLIIIVFIFSLHVIFDIPYFLMFLGGAGIIALLFFFNFLKEKSELNVAESVSSCVLIEETAVYKREKRHTGYTVSWKERRELYEYVDVLDYYKCVFSVTYKDGNKSEIKCKKGDVLYLELIKKAEGC